MQRSRNRLRGFGLVFVLIASALARTADLAQASAVPGTVVASGDTNIANALTGDGTSVNAGNQKFFLNLLGIGHTVLIAGQAGNSGISSSNTDLNTYYNSVGGVSSSIATGAITTAELAGVDLFISLGRSVSYSNDELSALSGFHTSGHTILVAGDAEFFAVEDTVANQLLSGLSTPFTLVPNSLDAGYQTASGSHILSNPLTSGVASFTYAYTSTIAGGFPLFSATDGETFIASNTPEPASIMMLAVGGCLLRRRSRAA